MLTDEYLIFIALKTILQNRSVTHSLRNNYVNTFTPNP
jgi:hypothetical protein